MVKKTILAIGFITLLFMCSFILEANSPAHAAKAALYYKYRGCPR